MVHDRFEYPMPAAAEVVFDAFHFHCWRSRWDTLVRDTRVEGGAPCPFVGAETVNAGAGWMRGLSMRTRFVSFDRPQVAAAAMVGQSFPFRRWAASMRHRAIDARQSVMIYTYTLEAEGAPLRRLTEPLLKRAFDRQTHRRFASLQRFLGSHRAEVEDWQARRNEASA